MKFKVELTIRTRDLDSELNLATLSGIVETVDETAEVDNKVSPVITLNDGKSSHDTKPNIKQRWTILVTKMIAERTNLKPPQKIKATTYSVRWDTPLQTLLGVINSFGIEYGEEPKLSSERKYNWDTARAVAYVMIDAFNKMKADGLTISAYQSLEQVAMELARETDYLKKAIAMRIANNWPDPTDDQI